MANKLRIGIIGANLRSHWASKSHFPALFASPDWGGERRVHDAAREC